MNCVRRAGQRGVWCILLGVGAILSSPSEALAYLDPGTGSYAFQILIAFIVGAVFSLKVYWKKIKSAFFRLFRGSDKNKSKLDTNQKPRVADHVEIDPR